MLPVSTPSTDIVLGVAQAADPQKYRAAVERLRSLSAEAASSRPSADVKLPGASVAPPPANPGPAPAPGLSRVASVQPRQGRAQGPGDAFSKLEAFVLQTFIQSMLPKDAQHVFGKGTAGEIWRSMLAEKLGAEIAKSGQIGIAKHLMSGSVAGALLTAQGASPSAGETAQAGALQPSTSPEQG